MKLDAVEDAREVSLYPYEILIPGLGYPSTESAVLPGCKANDEPSYRGTTQALRTTPLDENIELVVGRVKAEEDAGGEKYSTILGVSKHTDSETPCQRTDR